MEMSIFDRIFEQAQEEDRVKWITYGQFMEIRNSGEKYFLLEVLPAEAYQKGHIEDAVSVPVDTIEQRCMEEMLNKDSNIVVYCYDFECTASTKAVKKLKQLGYKKVLDFKGGKKEWRKNGNKLVS
jgi:rhodanese-related sulfurtransferase